MFRLLSSSFPILLLLLLVTAGHGAEIAPQLQVEMTAAVPGETIPVIVTFAAETDLRHLQGKSKKARRSGVVKALRETADLSQREVKSLLKGRGKKFHELWIVNGLALEATPELIEKLAARPEVKKISPDEVVYLSEPSPSPQFTTSPEWDNLAGIHAQDLWSAGVRGNGIKVAILDSGVDAAHPDLASNFQPGGWFNPIASLCGQTIDGRTITCDTCGHNTATPCDVNGHGTGVMGVLAGGEKNGRPIGVAPGASWMAVKIFDDAATPAAPLSAIHRGFQWFLDPDGNPTTNDSPDVVNSSWGFEGTAVNKCLNDNNISNFQPDIQALKDAGIAVVFSAGNSGPGTATSTSPANYSNNLAVGSVNKDSWISSFSSRGLSACDGSTFPEIVAPGEFIRTAALSQNGTASWTLQSGTSFSAPHAAGVMALLLSYNPTLVPVDLETILQQTATPLGLIWPNNDYGYGLVNALAAFNQIAGVPDLSADLPWQEDAWRLDFGRLTPRTVVDAPVILRNAGDGLLHISGLGAVPSPFSIVSDTCSNTPLFDDRTCTVTVRFAPERADSFAGTLEVRSNDPDQGTISVHLSGQGNTLPPRAILTLPANGVQTVPMPVLLEWTQAADADGDAITHHVLLSRDADFSDAAPQAVLVGKSRQALLAGAGGLFLSGLAVGWRRRMSGTILLLAGLALLVSCGGGGGSDAVSNQPPVETFNITVTELSAGQELLPGTEYYWKVISEDARGGRSESATWRFTTASSMP